MKKNDSQSKKKRKWAAVGIIAAVIVIAAAVLVLILKGKDDTANQMFEGKGTQSDPYLIKDLDDLRKLRDTVNLGNDDFRDQYFLQTADIDLAQIDNWTPIGIFDSGLYFYGIYDGGNHAIDHLNIDAPKSQGSGNAGFFGQLGGTVCNLEIASGYVKGTCVGAITSHSASENARIINCINRANVRGESRAGGIADNFSAGLIANCANYGNIVADDEGYAASIVSYNAKYIYCCYGKENATTSNFTGMGEYIGEGNTVETSVLNDNIPILNDLFNLEDINISPWEADNEGTAVETEAVTEK